ncbi:LamG-like jellyroll fold domain-containing protein [Streptomyces sp. NPDC088812]|uniref:LamG-like jellyroll fold domain-containing protein n=1 Tax=Streptomyces sp. NPDC088812 TaxID=3365905 RepID=UPI0037FEF306
MTDTQNASPATAVGTTDRPSRLTAWWRFDEGAGHTATDSSGNGHTLVADEGVAWIPGGGIALDGDRQKLTTEGPAVRTDESFGVAVWVRLDSATLDGALRPEPGEYAWTAVSQAVDSHGAFYLGARLFTETGADGTEQAVLRWSFTVSPVDGPTSAFEWRHATSAAAVDASALDTWVLLVGVLDPRTHTARLLVPGVEDVRTVDLPEGWTYWHAEAPLQVGHGTWLEKTVDFWPGSIGPVRLFSGTLTPEDAAVLYRQDAPA